MFSSGSQRVLIDGRRGPGQEPRTLRAVPGLTGRRVGPGQGAAPVTPPPPAAASPAPPRVPGTCPTQHGGCFQHLRQGAEPLLHSRKIFVQGLGTAEEEINATLEPSGRCLVCACGAPASAASLGTPPHAPPACCQLFRPSVRDAALSSVRKHLRSRLCARHRAGPWPHLRGCCEGG